MRGSGRPTTAPAAASGDRAGAAVARQQAEAKTAGAPAGVYRSGGGRLGRRSQQLVIFAELQGTVGQQGVRQHSRAAAVPQPPIRDANALACCDSSSWAVAAAAGWLKPGCWSPAGGRSSWLAEASACASRQAALPHDARHGGAHLQRGRTHNGNNGIST